MGSRIIIRSLGMLSQLSFQFVFFSTLISIVKETPNMIIVEILMIIFILNILISLSVSYVNLFLGVTFGTPIIYIIITSLTYITNPILQGVIFYSIIAYFIAVMNQSIILLI